MARRVSSDWHEQARQLHAAGFSFRYIGKLLNRHYNSVYYVVTPSAQPKINERIKRWRKDHPAEYAVMVRRGRLRASARQEAEETGENVLFIYERWEVLQEREKEDLAAMRASTVGNVGQTNARTP